MCGAAGAIHFRSLRQVSRHGALYGCDDLSAGASPRSGVLRRVLQSRGLPANPRRSHGPVAWGRRLADLSTGTLPSPSLTNWSTSSNELVAQTEEGIGGYGELEASSVDGDGRTLLKVYTDVGLVDIHRTNGHGQIVDLTV